MDILDADDEMGVVSPVISLVLLLESLARALHFSLRWFMLHTLTWH